MNLESLRIILEITTYLITIFGVPVGIYVYLKKKNKEERDREYGTYHALDEKYLEFLNLCLEHTDLNIYNIEQENECYNEEQKKRELIIFEILISILERAYIMYEDQSTNVKRDQWEGWNSYMYDWMKRKRFRRAWEILGHQWDKGFEDHMAKVYEETAEFIESN